ncbi:hypothetical protein NL676_035951 [Syzygium grande]|nr:hypothetical protein NL676_035951 [Syzygium grande]
MVETLGLARFGHHRLDLRRWIPAFVSSHKTLLSVVWIAALASVLLWQSSAVGPGGLSILRWRSPGGGGDGGGGGGAGGGPAEAPAGGVQPDGLRWGGGRGDGEHGGVREGGRGDREAGEERRWPAQCACWTVADGAV